MSTTTSPSATKTVLVVGATRGIGRKFVELYTQRGWHVIGTARDLHQAEQLVALSPYKIVQLDSSDEASILRAAEDLKNEPIDLVINNAGIRIRGNLDVVTKADLTKHFEINTIGPLLVTRAFVPHLKAAVALRGSAMVAQISSLLGSIEFIRANAEMVANYNNYAYRTSKAALNMFTASVALDLKDDNISAFVLHPGLVATDMTNYAPEAITQDVSVEGMIDTLSKLTLADTGSFRNYDGKVLPW